MNADRHGSIRLERQPISRRFWGFLTVTVGAIALLSTGVLPYTVLRPEPAWKGRSLSSWLNDLRPYAQQSGASQDQAEAAVSAVGAQAIPLLLTWMGSADNSVKQVICQMLPRNLQLRWRPPGAFDRRWSAARAFMVLRTNPEPVAPALARMLGSGKPGRPAAAALAGIGMPAFTVLTNLLVPEGPANDAAYGLNRYGDFALPTLINALTNRRQIVHQAAFAGLRFCICDRSVWKDSDPSASSLQFTTIAMGTAMAANTGRGRTLLAQTLDQCLVSTNREVATAARLAKVQLGLWPC